MYQSYSEWLIALARSLKRHLMDRFEYSIQWYTGNYSRFMAILGFIMTFILGLTWELYTLYKDRLLHKNAPMYMCARFSCHLCCSQACSGWGGAVLGVGVSVEHPTSVWLGQLWAGGRPDLLRPQLEQPGAGEHVLHRDVLPVLFCHTLLHHHGVLLTSPMDPETGGHWDAWLGGGRLRWDDSDVMRWVLFWRHKGK